MTDIGIGNQCNNCCVMCTNVMPLPEDYKEPTTQQVINEIDKADSTILITGGEPTIRKDLFDILDYINMKYPDKQIKIITNARMFNYPEFAAKMKKVRNLQLITELYGSTPELHDRITRAKGSYHQSYNGIKNMLEHGFNVELRVVISRLNYRDIVKLVKLYEKEFGKAYKIVLFPIDIIGNAFKNMPDCVLKYKDFIPFVEEASELSDKIELFHIPYCVINKKYWRLIKGQTVPERRLMLKEICGGCDFEEECPRVWRTYAKMIGTDELKKIEDGSTKS